MYKPQVPQLESLLDMAIKILLFLLFLSIAHASNECLTSYCHKDGPIIRFPFWLQQQQQQQNCAPSGFNLSCNGQKYPILHIPGSGDFYLTSVYYYLRMITLQDVQGCLPTRLLSLNLSSTPFLAIMYRNYTLFSCAKGKVDSTGYYNRVVECASNETSDVVYATGDGMPYGLNISGCSKIATVSVPVSSFYNFALGLFPVDLELTWDVRDPPKGGNNKLSETRSSALIFTIPILFLLIMIVGFVCMKMRGSQHNNSSSIQISEGGGITSRGLDQSTIETYTMITIGESLVEGSNGVTCTICLTDYATNDTIRFMPNCEHYFHVECIDKWLSISKKCPVCRVSLQNANSC